MLEIGRMFLFSIFDSKQYRNYEHYKEIIQCHNTFTILYYVIQETTV